MGRAEVNRWRPVAGAVLVVGPVVALVVALAGCTTGDAAHGEATRPVSVAVVAPEVTFTPVDPGPAPTITVPPRRAGEVARVVVTRVGPGTSFHNLPGEAVTVGRTYTVEVACAAGRPATDRPDATDATDATGTTYAIYDAAPGTWGRGEPLYSRAFACDGTVQRTVDLGLPAGPVQIDVRGLPADAVAAYAVITPE